MDKLRGTIIGVLSLLDRSLYRTEIVKFVYMIDEMYYRHFGTTITGMSYKRDNFGPNSEGDKIVNEAEELVNLGFIHMSSEPNQYGETSYLYKLEKSDEESLNSLSETEKYVIKDVTCRYRKHSLQQLIKASKETESFKGVEQYQAITLKQSPEYIELVKSLKKDKSFVQGVASVVKEIAN
ncbi:hypothetical protein ES708_29668 [subsurface metagenome]